jgi:hypothetical protein
VPHATAVHPRQIRVTNASRVRICLWARACTTASMPECSARGACPLPLPWHITLAGNR